MAKESWQVYRLLLNHLKEIAESINGEEWAAEKLTSASLQDLVSTVATANFSLTSS